MKSVTYFAAYQAYVNPAFKKREVHLCLNYFVSFVVKMKLSYIQKHAKSAL
jgi:hypothetical protein